MSDAAAVVPVPGWEVVLERVAGGGTAVLIGGCDCGKSTLVRWLAAALVERGVPAAVLDADVGQSSLCIPGTVGLGTFSTEAEVSVY
ncbi:MAG TPA: Clp1/GlmU family protein, partial [Verrucomicrobiae bacterium]|nr:Clp1/GlmU family protein [Verrucomicrobiae bacterium]